MPKQCLEYTLAKYLAHRLSLRPLSVVLTRCYQRARLMAIWGHTRSFRRVSCKAIEHYDDTVTYEPKDLPLPRLVGAPVTMLIS
eukprot:1177564-Prorocentrum_minimum.AAC.6